MKDLFFNYTPINALNYSELQNLVYNENYNYNDNRNNLHTCVFYFSDYMLGNDINNFTYQDNMYFVGTIIIDNIPTPCCIYYVGGGEEVGETVIKKISDDSHVTLSNSLHYPIYGTVSFGCDQKPDPVN